MKKYGFLNKKIINLLSFRFFWRYSFLFLVFFIISVFSFGFLQKTSVDKVFSIVTSFNTPLIFAQSDLSDEDLIDEDVDEQHYEDSIENSEPILENTSVFDISTTSAIATAEVVDDGGLSINERGFVWSLSSEKKPNTSTSPEESVYEWISKETGSFGDGFFELLIDPLQADTEYFIRSYAKNSEGFGYSEEISFFTEAVTEDDELTKESGSGDFGTLNEGRDGSGGGPIVLNNSENGPDVFNVLLNNDQDISPVEGISVEVNFSAEISIDGGQENLDENSFNAVIYREGVGFECTEDPLNCYYSNDIFLDSCVGEICSLEGGFSLWFFAEPTDQGEYDEDGWSVALSVSDIWGSGGFATSSPVDVLTLLAINVIEDEIDFGEMEMGDDTGDVNKTTTIRNTGNSTVNLNVFGEDMSKDGYVISPSYQRWSVEPFDYSSGEGSSLDSEAIFTGLQITKKLSIEDVKESSLYWGLKLPNEPLLTGRYVGKNYFIAVPSN